MINGGKVFSQSFGETLLSEISRLELEITSDFPKCAVIAQLLQDTIYRFAILIIHIHRG